MKKLQREFYEKDIPNNEPPKDYVKELFLSLEDYVSLTYQSSSQMDKSPLSIVDICFIPSGKLKVKSFSINGDKPFNILVELEYLIDSSEESLKYVREKIERLGLEKVSSKLEKTYRLKFENF